MPNLISDPQVSPLISNNQISVNSSPHNFSKSILIGILIFVLLSLIVYGTYWYSKNYLVVPSSQPTLSNVHPEVDQSKNSFSNLKNQATPAATDETAEWKTYQNTQKGYSVKYPSDRMVRLICQNEELILEKRVAGNEGLDEKPLESCARDDLFDIEVHTYLAPLGKLESSSDYAVSKETITVAKLAADKYTVTPTANCWGVCTPEWHQEVRLNAGGKMYTFHLVKKEFSSVFDQILSTFKFL